VLWVGVLAGADALSALHTRVERALARQGLPPEERAFHGHITLGRAREPRGAPGLVEALAAAPEPLGEVTVEAVHLMRSDLHPAGARHSVLAREPLGGVTGSRV
jgi:2'-5' RNA ligase